jgi:hypothetical protein
MAMAPLELKRKELELIKVAAARADLEFKILEKEEEIIRIHQHIEAQLKREDEIRAELKQAKA